MDFISFIAFVVLFFWVWRIHLRLNKRTAQQTSPPTLEPTLATIPGTPTVATATLTAPLIPPHPHKSSELIAWLQEDWLLKLGAGLVLIAFGWFVTYAFLNNWIGPIGRIALGLVAGTAVLLLGWWRMHHYIKQGSIIMVLGSTIVLLTIFAAREIYGFFTPSTALLVMFATTAVTALSSVRFNNKALALASLVLAGIAPLLTNSPTPNYVGLFSYLLVVTSGMIWIIALKNWRDLTSAALVIIAIYSAPHWLGAIRVPDQTMLLILSFAFATLFFLTNTIGIFKMKAAPRTEIIPDLVAASGNGLFLLAWILTTAPKEWQSLIIAGWMIVFAAGAFAVFKISSRHEPFYVYAGVSIAMLAAATAVELEGPSLTMAYIIESALIPLIGYLLLGNVRVAERLALLLIGPAIMSVTSITSPAWHRGVLHDDFFVLLVLSSILVSYGLFFWWHEHKERVSKQQHLGIAFVVIGSIYAYALLWLTTHAAFLKDDTAVLISLVIYTIIGIAAYLYGEIKNVRVVRLYGGVLLGFVVGRLLVIDIWRLALTGRIITFFVIGMLLMSTAFLGRMRPNKTIDSPKSTTPV